ncbi:MAG: hypothetical protein UV82_C0006G0046 [Candidatus Magasanikbacteria bacterium GW2011_GWD2_43_18]|nr:MAG: hypothetical protein UV18_C0005G0041 [Candidatus Magasanikbacteria bacterium GW2011_GWC2_42_27]KKT04690.1 MAG: hypothetical protein UV82_C0006G0046 [Candidatus Magasanikbacteria bacterium GW2011_GWD2_43_18]KKT24536.1 MAG: hypothetical protein UW10_C0024G0005 [Candidatus Magasanikbacteria bacterium GW2011_GWA2_43_9]HBB37996.1 hypothetical protein [Candidatus Magasanikbacteria bacterium]HCC13252.1 hypothetical protein [Candidatus Magasanikbacteria bacterium]
MNTLTVQGMHCDACKKIIRMELDDAGLAEQIVDIELLPDERGCITLQESTSPETKDHITTVVNAIEGYSVV